jgi:hypothetical protein
MYEAPTLVERIYGTSVNLVFLLLVHQPFPCASLSRDLLVSLSACHYSSPVLVLSDFFIMLVN